MNSLNSKKDHECPLCNNKPFKKGDDQKILCIKHLQEVISLLICGIASEMSGIGIRDA